MLYQLKNLSEVERTLVRRSPIWVTLLIACADHDIEEAEIDRAKEIIHIKRYAIQNDVKHLYEELDKSVDDEIDYALTAISAIGDERIKFLEEHISKLNDIFPKLNHTYAAQLHKSLLGVALAVAQSEGGLFGIGRINKDEKKYIHLPMLNQP